MMRVVDGVRSYRKYYQNWLNVKFFATLEETPQQVVQWSDC